MRIIKILTTLLFCLILFVGCDFADTVKTGDTGGGVATRDASDLVATYTIVNQWETGFVASVTIQNAGTSQVDGWAIEWDYDGDQQITSSWNADLTQTGQHVVAQNLVYNGSIAANESVSFGFQGTYSGTNNVPSLVINGDQSGDDDDDDDDSGDDDDDDDDDGNTISAFSSIQAENYTSTTSSTLQVITTDNDGSGIGYIESGDTVTFSNIDFGDGAVSFTARVASQLNSSIEVRIGSASGTLLGTLSDVSTGSWDTYQELTTGVSSITGVNDLVLVFSDAVNVDEFTFLASGDDDDDDDDNGDDDDDDNGDDDDDDNGDDDDDDNGDDDDDDNGDDDDDDSSSTETVISLNGSSISVDGPNAVVNATTVTITASGSYIISGTLSDGQIIVADETETENVEITFNGVNITSSSSAPFYVTNADRTVINLAEGTTNTLTDATSYQYASGEDEPNACIFSKDDMTIKGDGTLIVNGRFNDGINVKDDLKIKSGNISVSAVDDGIRGKESITIKDGNITVNAGGDGLKSDEDEDAEKGFILVEGGSVEVTSAGDAIYAYNNVTCENGTFNLTAGGGSNITISDTSAKGIKSDLNIYLNGGTYTVSSADDCINGVNVTIAGGNYQLATSQRQSADKTPHGISADYMNLDGGDINITQSFEGLGCANTLTINDGTIHIEAADDGLSISDGSDSMQAVNVYLRINGGYLYVNADSGDGIDCNGYIEMAGGTVILNGTTASMNSAIDYNGSFTISGGFIIAAGSSGMAQAPGSNSSAQNALLATIGTYQAGTLCHLQNASGETLFTFAPAKQYQSIGFSSPELVNGTYSIYTGGSAYGSVTDGLYSNETYSNGTLYTTFTVSSKVTTLGQSNPWPW